MGGAAAGTFIQAEELIITENTLRIKVRDFRWRAWVYLQNAAQILMTFTPR